MSSPLPSKPVNIGTPKGSTTGTPLTGTPDIRVLRAQLVGTPPVNIPSRYVVDPIVGPSGSGSSLNYTSTPLHPMAAEHATIHRQASGDISQSGVDSGIADLDSLPDEEKARILRRHLVLREERQSRVDASSLSGSDLDDGPFSTLTPTRQRQENLDAFPITYEAPGADIT